MKSSKENAEVKHARRILLVGSVQLLVHQKYATAVVVVLPKISAAYLFGLGPSTESKLPFKSFKTREIINVCMSETLQRPCLLIIAWTPM